MAKSLGCFSNAIKCPDCFFKFLFIQRIQHFDKCPARIVGKRVVCNRHFFDSLLYRFIINQVLGNGVAGAFKAIFSWHCPVEVQIPAQSRLSPRSVSAWSVRYITPFYYRSLRRFTWLYIVPGEITEPQKKLQIISQRPWYFLRLCMSKR